MSAALQRVDVEALRARIERTKTDWRYAAENYYKILDIQSGDMVDIRFNEAQVRLKSEIDWFEQRNRPVRLWILKSRRAGLSTGCVVRMYHKITNNKNLKALILANEQNPAEIVFDIARKIWLNSPRALRPPMAPHLRDVPPKKFMEFPSINAAMHTASSKSLNQYIGGGFKIIHAAEVSRYAKGDDVFTSLWATLSHDPNSMFFGESTAFGMGGFFHEQVLNAQETKGQGRDDDYGSFRLLFIARHEMSRSFQRPLDNDAEAKRLRESLTLEERTLMRRYPSIGLPQIKWERAMKAGPPYNKDPGKWEQDYPNTVEEAFIASGVTVFGNATIKRYIERCEARDERGRRHQEPVFVGDIYWGDPKLPVGSKENPHDLVRRPEVLSPGDAKARGYQSNVNEGVYNNLRVYRWPRKGERLFIGGDVGRGDASTKNGDYSTLVVCALNEDGGRDDVIIVWRGHCNPIHFAELASALAWRLRYEVGSAVIPPLLTLEWNGPGTGANVEIDHRNLYDHTFRYFHPGVHAGKPSNHIGWESNGKTKPLMVDITVNHVQRDLIDIPDREIITEMSIYRRTSDFDDANSYEGVGGHDDLITALEIAVVTMRRIDLNWATHKGTYSAEDRDEAQMRYSAADLDSFDPSDAMTDMPRYGPGDMRIVSGAGAGVDPERFLSDGDWGNWSDVYDSERGYSGPANDYADAWE